MRCYLVVILLSCCTVAGAQSVGFGNKATIYLVRHAEKMPGKDPLLTPEGNARAGDLYRALKNKSIQRIYVTEFKRTQNTADSLRLLAGIDTVHYDSDTSCTDLFNNIAQHHDENDVILIVGHSNTIPLIIKKLGVANYPADYIPDNEFDNLFIVHFKKGKAVLKEIKYGAASAISAKKKVN